MYGRRGAMFENYRRWAEQLIEAGVDIESVTKPVEFIFREAREKGIRLDFWQVCGAIWFLRKTQGGIGDRIHSGRKR